MCVSKGGWVWRGADMPHRDAHLAGLGSGSVLLDKREISPERQPLPFPEPSGPERSRAPWEGGTGSYRPDKLLALGPH